MTRHFLHFMVRRALTWLDAADKTASPLQRRVRLYDQSAAMFAAKQWPFTLTANEHLKIVRIVRDEWQAQNPDMMQFDADELMKAGLTRQHRRWRR